MGQVERLTNSTTGGPLFVDVEDGRIVRMFPIDLAEDDKGDWTIEARGRSFTPPRRTTLSPHAQAQRSMIYSPKRILTPLKRVDFDHKGARNTRNRGVSGYEPISWEAALDIVADEVERCHREIGPGSIMTTESSHHLWGNIGYRHSAYNRFLNLMGFSHCAHNPDSWEGWHWGGIHDVGQQPPPGHPRAVGPAGGRAQAQRDGRVLVRRPGDHGRRHLLRLREHVAALLAEGARHQDGVRRSLLQPHRRALLRQVVRAAPRHRRRLRPRHRLHVARPRTSTTRSTCAEHTVGFDEWNEYVLGKTDGVPKTPDWAEGECGIPAREIRALAREWGAKKTMLAAGGLGGWGGACRSATGNEWARTMIALAAMQGYGQAGQQHLGHHAGRARRRVVHLPRLR